MSAKRDRRARCSSCGADAPAGARFCPSCGARTNSAGDATVTREAETKQGDGLPHTPGGGSGWLSSASIDHGRFTPGIVLDGRYRIVGLLGRGGMGEVYRADDLRLGQAVALKFLPEALAHDGKRLAHLHTEVRMARQVAHANVCRVYDIGEADGHVFISMEYVDGEDLAASLKRIGRFPEDKAIDLAGQICAGLAAAHERGVIHRDLKPANIMVDAAGKVRVMDFGLATAGEPDVERRGTPAYMAPEQIEGGDATTRSDIYALGLVLYELFTGRRVFQASSLADLVLQHASGDVTPPTAIVKGLDAATERAILRCLQPDPMKRPGTAIAVAAALPGGDPLAAALAAGETPSPAMVAAAGTNTATVAPRAGACWIAAGLLGLVAIGAISDRVMLLARVPFDKSPEVLLDRARSLEASSGYGQNVADRAWGLEIDNDALGWLSRTRPNDAMAALEAGTPGVLQFWYRSSPRAIATVDPMALRPSRVDPPSTLSGMVSLVLDATGRLQEFHAVPPQAESATPAVSTAVDWKAFFDAAGLDDSRFIPATPEWVPPVYADVRQAWTGTLNRAPDVLIRVEAAAHRGRLVDFVVLGPWSRSSLATPGPTGGTILLFTVGGFAYIVAFLAAVLLARRNLMLGRADRRSAAGFAMAIIGMGIARWAVGSHHVQDPAEINRFLLGGVALSLYNGGLSWLFYLAAEPTVRRVWPRALVTWTRLAHGSWRDPMVGRDLLSGTACGVLFALAGRAFWLVAEVIELQGFQPHGLAPVTMQGARYFAGFIIDRAGSALLYGIGFTFAMTMFLVVFRRRGLAFCASWLVTIVISAGLPAGDLERTPMVYLSANALILAMTLAVLVRFGVAASSATFFAGFMTWNVPMSLSPARQYFGVGLTSALILVTLMAIGFYLARAGEPLFGWSDVEETPPLKDV